VLVRAVWLLLFEVCSSPRSQADLLHRKTTLFSDFYRDIVDIGYNFNPLIMASDEQLGQIVDANGKVVRKVLNTDQRRRYYRGIADNGAVASVATTALSVPILRSINRIFKERRLHVFSLTIWLF